MGSMWRDFALNTIDGLDGIKKNTLGLGGVEIIIHCLLESIFQFGHFFYVFVGRCFTAFITVSGSRESTAATHS